MVRKIDLVILVIIAIVGVGIWVTQQPSFRYKELPYDEVRLIHLTSIDAECGFYETLLRDREIVIRNQGEYDSLINSIYSASYEDHRKRYGDGAYTYERFLEKCSPFPQIDFSQKTLLGKFAGGGGCNVEFDKHVYDDLENERLIYSIRIIGEGPCTMYGWSINWVTVTKIPDDFTVEFQITQA